MSRPLEKSPKQQQNSIGRTKARVLFAFLCLAFAAGVFVPSHGARAAVGFVQENQGTCSDQGSCSSTTISFTANNTAGNLIVVAFDYGDAVGLTSVTDTQGNVYVSAGTEVHQGAGHWFADIYYAKNIASRANSVTVKLNGVASYLEVYIHEYSGLDTAFPLDATASSIGNSGSLDSGPATTNFANELVFGFGTSSFTAGPGFTARSTILNPGDSITEDRIVSAIGTYDATASFNGLNWSMQMATFKAASPGIQVRSRSDILSNSQPSATSNHTVAFTVNNSIYGSSASNSSTLTLTLDPNFTIPVGMDCGDVDVATSVQFSFNYPGCVATATAWGFSAAGSVITLVPPSGTGVYVPTSTQVTIKIGSNATVGQQGGHWITNPSTGGVYTISVGGTFGGSGNMLVSINSGVTVQATVAESLSLSVSSIGALSCTADDGATITAIGTAATSVPFGIISANSFYQGCQDLVVSTNAGNGYSLTVQESSAMRTVDGRFSIPDTTCDNADCSVVTATTWVTPTKNGFGHTCFNQSGSDCNPTYGSGKKFKPVPNIPTGTSPGQISFVQQNAGNCSSACSSTTIPFTVNNTAGNLIVLGFNYPDTVSFLSVTDTLGNVYVQAGKEVHLGGTLTDIYYAKNIKGGANSVTINISAAANAPELYIHEYSGLDTVSPLDVTASSIGNSANADSGPATTNFANELIFGFGAAAGNMSAGAGFTARSTFNGNISEDKMVSAFGTYDAVATVTPSAIWEMLLATFRASNTPVSLMSNTGTVTNSTGRVKYRLSAGAAQPAGKYTTVVTYTIYAAY